MEKPEFSDLESDLEEELEVENWDEWEGSQHEQEDEDEGLNFEILFDPKTLIGWRVTFSRK